MPTYNYECKACKNRLTVFQSMNDSPLQDCDKCGGKRTLKRLITGGTGMVFKGSGFYLTDYKNKKPESNSKNDSKNDKKQGNKVNKTEKKTKIKDNK